MSPSIIAPLAEVELKDPITFGSDVFTHLKVTRKPTLGDMYGIPMDENMSAESLALLLGKISNVSTPGIKLMSLMDVGRVMEVLRPFLPSSQ